ncbi:hypothetical protein ACJIZ3_022425 [Penstemon smallii]|uniref:N-acetyltransferase domain-containing protein n=1 Tax=Penstemon smallii TaxID=265156 RepID=A0ABD3TL63_9LAMI
MAVITSVVYVDYLPSKFRWLPRTTAKINSPPPILISTNPLHVNPNNLKELYTLCHHSCHRFPTVDAAGRVEPVDLLKLRTAISHSSIVVSVFTKPEFLEPQSSISNGIGGEWIRNLAPVTLENGELIGFGRAVTDMALTASIYDVMVHPTLQGRGIGRMIVQRIIRMLTNRDIYDIAALCTDNERFIPEVLFFKACGFGDDMLGSTTMMYTRPPSGYSKDEQMISAGRKLLLIPQPRELSR